MKGIVEYSGLIVKNKDEAIKEARKVLNELLLWAPNTKRPWVYVYRYDSPEIIWFSVGYDKRDVVNHVQLRKGAKTHSKMRQ